VGAAIAVGGLAQVVSGARTANAAVSPVTGGDAENGNFSIAGNLAIGASQANLGFWGPGAEIVRTSPAVQFNSLGGGRKYLLGITFPPVGL
jgi:hypothetical protein